MSNSKEENKNKYGKLSIIPLILVSVFICVLIICAFFFSATPYIITKSIIVLTCLLVVLILGNKFDKIHFGSLFELSRKIDEGNNKLTKLDEKTENFYNKIFDLNYQTQVAQTFNNSTLQIFHDNDIAKKEKAEEEKSILAATPKNKKRLNYGKFCDLIINKYATNNFVQGLQYNIALVEINDQISNKQVNFDALQDEGNVKCFIDVLNVQTPMLYHDHLYIKLNKILSYRQIYKANAILIILLPKGNGTDIKKYEDFFDKYFSPAIQNHLLQLKFIDYTEEEYNSCLKEIKQ